MNNATPLPRLGIKLLELTGNPGPGYRKLYLSALDGTLPVETKNGRLFVLNVNLPRVVESLGLTIRADSGAV